MDIHNIFTRVLVIPVIILNDIKHAIPLLIIALIDSGITTLEITLRTFIALDAIRAIKNELPEYIVGAGTVIKSSRFSEEIKAVGADFAVSPGISSELITVTRKINVPYMSATATLSELLLAIQHIKFFPTALNGGMEGGFALRSFVSVFPGMRFVLLAALMREIRRIIFR